MQNPDRIIPIDMTKIDFSVRLNLATESVEQSGDVIVEVNGLGARNPDNYKLVPAGSRGFLEFRITDPLLFSAGDTLTFKGISEDGSTELIYIYTIKLNK